MEKLSDVMKNILLAGIGAAAATTEKSRDVLDELVKKGELTVEQGKVLNEELKHKIKETGTDKKSDIAEAAKTMSSEERKALIEKLMAMDEEKSDNE